MRTLQLLGTIDGDYIEGAGYGDCHTVVGRHSIWCPTLELKMPFSWGGALTKYGHTEQAYPIQDTLPHELAILRALAALGMAPPIGELVYVEELVSDHPGGWTSDPVGAFGYEMADATKLPPGKFTLSEMLKLPIAGSEGAWGDILKPGNVVNGYLVDVRRSAWDMLRWTGPDLPTIPVVREDAEALIADVNRLCQFPQGQRERAYQDFWLAGQWRQGQRRVVERARLLGFDPRPGESVLEIGCQSGGFLQHAALATVSEATLLGVEIDPDYVRCARRLARHGWLNICYRQMDAVREMDALVAWVKQRCPHGLTHLILCSMEKHLGELELWRLVDGLAAKHTYIETNAVAKDSGEGAEPSGPLKMWPGVQFRGGKHVGISRDRNLRQLYRIDR